MQFNTLKLIRRILYPWLKRFAPLLPYHYSHPWWFIIHMRIDIHIFVKFNPNSRLIGVFEYHVHTNFCNPYTLSFEFIYIWSTVYNYWFDLFWWSHICVSIARMDIFWTVNHGFLTHGESRSHSFMLYRRGIWQACECRRVSSFVFFLYNILEI